MENGVPDGRLSSTDREGEDDTRVGSTDGDVSRDGVFSRGVVSVPDAVSARDAVSDGVGQTAVDLVTVDGGASLCRLAAFDVQGRRLAGSVVDGHASLTLGEAEAWANIRLGIARLAEALGEGGDDRGARPGLARSVTSPRDAVHWLPPRLALGLAGALQDERRARFLALVNAATGGALECRLVTDGYAQLVGASGGAPGICLAVGTGSVVHWLDERGVAGMAGGWGFPIGDEGSGAWLGARLLQRYLWHRDGEPSDSSLMPILATHPGDSVPALQRWTTDARSTTHARLARLVVGQAELGDALAVSLMQEGAARCLRLVALAPSGLPVHVTGGLGAAYAPYLAAALGARLSPPRGDALDGLCTIARSREHS